VIDIHCHILPGIDDGPSEMQESIKMAEIAARDGITKIVATPHIKNTLHPVSSIRNSIARLNKRLADLGISIEIMQGADVNAMLDVSLLKGYTINNTQYILVEFPHSHLPNSMREVLFKMMVQGYRPIITHPERNVSVIRDPRVLIELINGGVLAQITADSITGTFGIDIQECSRYLLKKNMIRFIATDAHSSHHRKPVLSQGLKAAEKIIGKEKALKLVTVNPEAVVKGKPLRG
jgi:protein-tyrosine phosphatase